MPRIWIDTETGTYGNIDSLVIAHVHEETLALMEDGSMSDSEISDLGRVRGVRLDWILLNYG